MINSDFTSIRKFNDRFLVLVNNFHRNSNSGVIGHAGCLILINEIGISLTKFFHLNFSFFYLNFDLNSFTDKFKIIYFFLNNFISLKNLKSNIIFFFTGIWITNRPNIALILWIQDIPDYISFIKFSNARFIFQRSFQRNPLPAFQFINTI